MFPVADRFLYTTSTIEYGDNQMKGEFIPQRHIDSSRKRNNRSH